MASNDMTLNDMTLNDMTFNGRAAHAQSVTLPLIQHVLEPRILQIVQVLVRRSFNKGVSTKAFVMCFNKGSPMPNAPLPRAQMT